MKYILVQTFTVHWFENNICQKKKFSSKIGEKKNLSKSISGYYKTKKKTNSGMDH